MKGRGARARRVRGRAGERLRQRVLKRDDYRCQQCGKRGRMEVDHIEPRHRGGSDDLGNLQALCSGQFGCHARKTRAESGGRPMGDGEKAWLRFRDELR